MDLLADLDVRLELQTLTCGAGADLGSSAQPYLWVIFFKLDGASLMVTDTSAGEMTGEATVHAPRGSHGNLGVASVTVGDVVPIPASLGRYETVLRVIPVQSAAAEEGGRAVMGGVGAMCVLREADERSDERSEARHTALRQRVKSTLDALVRARNASHRTFTDSEVIEALSTRWQDVVREGEDWVVNPDDTLGVKVWYFSHASLAVQGRQRIAGAWGEGASRWSVAGGAYASASKAEP